jgi:RsiW-degrading membrane proteinase PrsW (M82 family)
MIILVIAFVIILALLPGFAWLVFYLGEDPHKEPKRLIALAFSAGFIASIVAIIIEWLFNKQIAGFGIQEFSIISLIGLALIEETLKFFAAYFSVNKDPKFKEPIDAMIYSIVAALGFATFENIGVIAFTQYQNNFFEIIFQTSLLRFVGATLLHSLASGIVGYYWAKGMILKKTKQFVIFGIIIASVLHAIFNYLIISYENITYAIIFLMVVGLFVLVDFEKIKLKKINIKKL